MLPNSEVAALASSGTIRAPLPGLSRDPPSAQCPPPVAVWLDLLMRQQRQTTLRHWRQIVLAQGVYPGRAGVQETGVVDWQQCRGQGGESVDRVRTEHTLQLSEHGQMQWPLMTQWNPG